MQALDQKAIDARIPAVGGSYVLILRSDITSRITIGKLGKMPVISGFYLYVGSAFGPGGLKARLGRHAKREKSLRWHIDYLRPHLDLKAVCYSQDPERHEDIWSGQVSKWPDASIPMPGFGASDSQAVSHLFYFRKGPSEALYQSLKGQKLFYVSVSSN